MCSSKLKFQRTKKIFSKRDKQIIVGFKKKRFSRSVALVYFIFFCFVVETFQIIWFVKLLYYGQM